MFAVWRKRIVSTAILFGPFGRASLWSRVCLYLHEMNIKANGLFKITMHIF